jgi:hypothetical protein
MSGEKTPGNSQPKHENHPPAERSFKNSSGQEKPELLGTTLKKDSVSYLLEWLSGFDVESSTSGESIHLGAEAEQVHQEGAGTSGERNVPVERFQAIRNPDPDKKDRRKKWATIGWEVFERKALLIAAARDLQDNGCTDPVKLAAADVFVEKAQVFLTERGDKLYRWGRNTAICAVIVMLCVGIFLTLTPVSTILSVLSPDEAVSNAYLAVVILKATTAGGFFAGVIYFLVSLSRAFYHEGTVLFSRRHSLRFGRLFVYLMSDTMRREDLEAVFNWNAEFSTAFKDIRPDGIAKSPALKLIESVSPAELIKAVGELAKLSKAKGGEDKE